MHSTIHHVYFMSPSMWARHHMAASQQMSGTSDAGAPTMQPLAAPASGPRRLLIVGERVSAKEDVAECVAEKDADEDVPARQYFSASQSRVRARCCVWPLVQGEDGMGWSGVKEEEG